jgi:hypothetical protein
MTTSTATSPLGALLSAGLHHSAGLGGSLASNTSRYFSVDFGLIHFVALDLNVYYGCDTCTADPKPNCVDKQKAWLDADLDQANANRDQVPWIVVMSHFPFYCTGCLGSNAMGEKVSARYYESADAEFFGNGNLTHQVCECV